MSKKVVVFGGSRGIGKAIAKAFLEDGDGVFLVARDLDELAYTQKELSGLGEVSIVAADVSKRADVERIADEVKKKWGAPDVLINAAGIYGPIGPVTDVDPALWLEAVTVNLFGTFLATRSFAVLMKQKKQGVIINFVGGGEGAYPNFSSYVSAKGGVARFTETVAAELNNDGIAVNAIAPGAVNTKLLDDIIAAGPEKSGKETYEKSLKQKESGGVSPEKAAALCVFLASDKARGLTGKILSAVWDAYATFPEHIHEIMSSDVYTMRRVVPGDRLVGGGGDGVGAKINQ
jgi:NAD(P)-dependent dehydrogenase (short-subunit alcohol dehydrogenase family)